MAIVDLVIPVGAGEVDELTVKLTPAGEVELRQVGQVVTIAKERRVELIDALIVAYKAVDQMSRRQGARPKGA